jgi:hypothetical protein
MPLMLVHDEGEYMKERKKMQVEATRKRLKELEGG